MAAVVVRLRLTQRTKPTGIESAIPKTLAAKAPCVNAHNLLASLGGMQTDGSPAGAPLFLEVLRELSEADLRETAAPAELLQIKELKSAHHGVARLLAQGRSLADTAVITGYSIGYLSRLRQNPAFQELQQHYGLVEDFATADVLQQMQDVGLEALSILRERQELEPEKFSTGQLQENIRLLLLEPQKHAALRAGGVANAPAVSIPITFVQAPGAGALGAIEAEYSMEPRK